MPWSYDSASTSALAQVRRWIGDTNASSKLVDDEVIEGLLDGGTDAATVLRAAATAARFCLAAMARDPDRSIEGLQVTRARIEAYQSIVDDLESRAGSQPTSLATMSAGNISKASDAVILEDEDYEPVEPGYLDERVS